MAGLSSVETASDVGSGGKIANGAQPTHTAIAKASATYRLLIA